MTDSIKNSKHYLKGFADGTIYGIENQHQNEQKFIDEIKDIMRISLCANSKYNCTIATDKYANLSEIIIKELAEKYNLGTNKRRL